MVPACVLRVPVVQRVHKPGLPRCGAFSSSAFGQLSNRSKGRAQKPQLALL